MFSGLTNFLWGSSAPAPAAPEVPARVAAAQDDELCPMEIGSDTACSDEELVHLPKPNSDGEEDWVVVTEGRSGKKEAPKKKKQGDVPMCLEARTKEKDVSKSGDQLLMEDSRKSKKTAKAMRLESERKNRELQEIHRETMTPIIIDQEMLFSAALKWGLNKDNNLMPEPIENANVNAHANMPVEPATVEVEPKLSKVERKLESMNLNRTTFDHKRGRVEARPRNTTVKRAKCEPKIFEAKTDTVSAATEMVQEVDVKQRPKRVSVEPKLVTDELKLVRAEPEIVPAKPEIVVETRPEARATRSRTVKMPEMESTESDTPIVKEEAAKEQSEGDDTGFQLVHSRYNRYNCAKTKKEAKRFNLRQRGEGSTNLARTVPDEIRIERKMITEETPAKLESEEIKVDVIKVEPPVKVESEEVKVDVIKVKTPVKVESEEVKVDVIKVKTPVKVESEKVKVHVIKVKEPVKVESDEVKVDVINDKTDYHPAKTENWVKPFENRVPVKIQQSFSSFYNSPTTMPGRPRRTRGRKGLDDKSFDLLDMELSILDRDMDLDFVARSFSQLYHSTKKTRHSDSSDFTAASDQYMVARMLEERSWRGRGRRDYYGSGRLTRETPSYSSLHPWCYAGTATTTRARNPYTGALVDNSRSPTSEDFDREVDELCSLLNDKQRAPHEVAAVKRVLRSKLEGRKEELEKELNPTKEHEAKVAEQALKREEQKREMRLTRQAVHPVEHRRLSRKNIEKSNAARLTLSAGSGRLRRSDRLQPRRASGANNNRKCS